MNSNVFQVWASMLADHSTKKEYFLTIYSDFRFLLEFIESKEEGVFSKIRKGHFEKSNQGGILHCSLFESKDHFFSEEIDLDSSDRLLELSSERDFQFVLNKMDEATLFYEDNIPVPLLALHQGGLLPFQSESKFGFKNKQGQTHIPAVFSSLIPFDTNHRAWVNESFDTTNPRWSMIDLRGNYLTDVPYLEVLSDLPHGYKVKTIKGDWKCIDLLGNLIH